MQSLDGVFLATDYCGLCCGEFPPHALRGVDAWQSWFRAVLCLGSVNEISEENIVLTKPATIPNINEILEIILLESPKVETVRIRRNSQYNEHYQIGQTAFCFHSWCYSVLTWKKHCPRSNLLKLVRSLTPSSPSLHNPRANGWQFNLSGPLQALLGDPDYQNRMERVPGHTDNILQRRRFELICQLPEELRSSIWRYVGLTTPSSSFVLVAGETSRLAQCLTSSNSSGLALKRASCLSAKTVSVFGTEYIQCLVDEKSDASVCVPGPVTGLRFVVNLYGVRAVKVLGVDWETDWLGDMPGPCDDSWHGIVRARPPALHFRNNDLICTNISSSDQCSKSQVMWDQVDFPSSVVDWDTELFDFDRDFIRTRCSPGRPREQLFLRYLPLYHKDEYVRGLTVYVSGNGVTGMEAHFTHESRLSGCRNGCAHYLVLSPNERIAYTWLRIVKARGVLLAKPALTIQTTLERIHSFGPYILPSYVSNNEYMWTLLESQGYITGFYHEVPDSDPTIMRLGVASDGTSLTTVPLAPQYHHCDFPRIAGPNAGLFLSVAVLDMIEKVEVCRLADRCTGMLLHYLGRPSVVLGQWYTSPASQHFCIYSSIRPSITAIGFQTKRSGKWGFVSDIWVSQDNTRAPLELDNQVFFKGERIAWWFSDHYDAILPWKGALLDIPEGSMLQQ